MKIFFLKKKKTKKAYFDKIFRKDRAMILAHLRGFENGLYESWSMSEAGKLAIDKLWEARRKK